MQPPFVGERDGKLPTSFVSLAYNKPLLFPLLDKGEKVAAHFKLSKLRRAANEKETNRELQRGDRKGTKNGQTPTDLVHCTGDVSK
jgi:hypothetical protein